MILPVAGDKDQSLARRAIAVEAVNTGRGSAVIGDVLVWDEIMCISGFFDHRKHLNEMRSSSLSS